MGECPICICPYTKDRRKKITCDFCAYEACRECVKRYVLSTPETPHCMNCQKTWGRIVLSNKFTQSFINNEFKHARENILLDREKSMFQATQPFIELKMREIEITNKISQNYVTIRDIKLDLRNLVPVNMETKHHEIELRKQIVFLEFDNEELSFEKNLIQNGVIIADKQTAREFIHKCPRGDCNGFLSKMWKCAVCKLYSCKDCHEPLDEGHTCDPNTIETIKHLSTSEYRNCPKCSASIYKIEGCSQMYCTHCRTAFDWKTGRIVTGRIHNPHYYEYMRTRGQAEREIGDLQCGGLRDLYSVANVCGWNSPIIAFHRKLVEFEALQMRAEPEVDIFQLNLDERVQFLMKRMSEQLFKTTIQQKDKAIQKKREILLVNTTFMQIMCDIYGRLERKNINDIMKEIQAGCEYVNKLWADISRAYSCVVPLANFETCTIKNQKV